MTKQKRRKQSRHRCPLCAEPRPNIGLPIAIPLGIPTYWSPEAALAIFEFVDGMRDIILAVYGIHIQDAARQIATAAPDAPICTAQGHQQITTDLERR
jgi:hypothetical protein